MEASFHRIARDQMLIDDFGSIFGTQLRVPHPLWIDHCHRPESALGQTARFVDSNPIGDAGGFCPCPEGLKDFESALMGARAAGEADEDVTLKLTHLGGSFPFFQRRFRWGGTGDAILTLSLG